MTMTITSYNMSVDSDNYEENQYDFSSKANKPTSRRKKIEAVPKMLNTSIESYFQPSQRKNGPVGLDECQEVLTKVFGHTQFRGKQREVIEAAVSGKDVFVVAPTGMGKSICFQVPAVAESSGITLVISPLLALMKNQISKLRENRVRVAAYTSDTSTNEKKQIIADLASGNPVNRLLYVTPEQLKKSDFNNLLLKVHSCGNLNRLVIDEAHCISEWGHDFRSDYRRLGTFRDRFESVPIMALTASATAAVQDDIVSSLQMDEERLVRVVHPFDRPNLFYEIRYSSISSLEMRMEDVHSYIALLHQRRGRPSSGIVYCRTRETCDQLSHYLRGRGISSRPYHRGIKAKKLDETLKEWEEGGDGQGGVDVVCATIAFGMGIDKGDVRYIIHFDLPKSFEGYYQETGRAGRDGDPAKCVLYYSREDVIRVKQLAALSRKKRKYDANLLGEPEPSQRSSDSLTALVNFAESTTCCRHISICAYFDNSVDKNDPDIVKQHCDTMCDICRFPEKTKKRYEELSSEDWVLSQIQKIQREVADEDCDEAEEDDCAYPHMEIESEIESNNYGDSVEHSGLHSVDQTKVLRDKSNLIKGVPLKRSGSISSLQGTSHQNLPTFKRARIEASATTSYGPQTYNSAVKGKTFRAPFKVPFKVTLQDDVIDLTEPTEPVDELLSEETEKEHQTSMDIDDDDDEVTLDLKKYKRNCRTDVSIQVVEDVEDAPSLVDSDVDDDELEPDAAFSQKFSISTRKDTIHLIRKELHRVFLRNKKSLALWLNIKHEIKPDQRSRFLSFVARDLEFMVHSLSVTTEGYRSRSKDQISAVKQLSNEDVWDESNKAEDIEDGKEIVDILQRLAKTSAWH